MDVRSTRLTSAPFQRNVFPIILRVLIQQLLLWNSTLLAKQTLDWILLVVRLVAVQTSRVSTKLNLNPPVPHGSTLMISQAPLAIPFSVLHKFLTSALMDFVSAVQTSVRWFSIPPRKSTFASPSQTRLVNHSNTLVSTDSVSPVTTNAVRSIIVNTTETILPLDVMTELAKLPFHNVLSNPIPTVRIDAATVNALKTKRFASMKTDAWNNNLTNASTLDNACSTAQHVFLVLQINLLCNLRKTVQTYAKAKTSPRVKSDLLFIALQAFLCASPLKPAVQWLLRSYVEGIVLSQ